MEMTGEYRIAAPQQAVWDALNDPETLRLCIPGCRALDQTGQQEFTATVTARIGPIAATFKGKVELSELDPPNSYVISGRGQGGPAGFAKGAARVSLSREGQETVLRYVAEIDVGGKLAAVGGRLIDGVAKTMADSFFGAFAARLAGGGNAEAATRGAPFPELKSLISSGASMSAPGPLQPAITLLSLLDRLAWLVAGAGIGIVLTLYRFGHF